MATFTSTVSFTDAQIAAAPPLEPAFDHLLRNSMTHDSIITILRVNEVTDLDAFVNMFDSEAALKEGAGDLGIDMTAGGLPHKREFARVVTAWKTAKVMADKVADRRSRESAWSPSHAIALRLDVHHE